MYVCMYVIPPSACPLQADLTRATMTGANLEGANLSAACLEACGLESANLTWAVLREASLSWARCPGTGEAARIGREGIQRGVGWLS